MKRIVAEPARCLACRACEMACALAHCDTDDLVEAIRSHKAKPRVYIEAAGGLAVPLQCRHCDNAPCVAVCPSGALSRASSAEPVLVNDEKCIGCAFCVEACPFGVVQLTETASDGDATCRKVVLKCDLCASRLAENLQPACVVACPVGALAFEEADDGAKRSRARAAAQAATTIANDNRK